MSLDSSAFNLTVDQLAKWLIELFPFKTQIAALWPFRPVRICTGRRAGSLRTAIGMQPRSMTGASYDNKTLRQVGAPEVV